MRYLKLPPKSKWKNNVHKPFRKDVITVVLMKCRSIRFSFLKFNWDTLSNLIGHLKKALLPKSVKIVDLWYFCKLILLPAE